MKKQNLEKIVDMFDQCTLALKFYVKTGKDKYLDEITWAVKRLNRFLEKHD